MIREITPSLSVAVSLFLVLAACSGPAIVESSTTTVTVRYGAIDGIEDATVLAEKACASHQKIARLRNTANFGLSERYGHFDCVCDGRSCSDAQR